MLHRCSRLGGATRRPSSVFCDRYAEVDRDAAPHWELFVRECPAPPVVTLGREEVRLHIVLEGLENFREGALGNPQRDRQPFKLSEMVGVAGTAQDVVDRV